jgi:exodeoxyribonuclease-3
MCGDVRRDAGLMTAALALSGEAALRAVLKSQERSLWRPNPRLGPTFATCSSSSKMALPRLKCVAPRADSCQWDGCRRSRRTSPASDDTHSRYIEAAIGGLLVGCFYLPNGNPAPGPKFDYKLRWFDRLTDYAKTLLESGAPAVLAGDFNVMPTDLDVYAPERWVDDALFRPEVRDAYRRLVEQGWTDALRALNPGERIYTFWKYFRNAFGRDAGLRIGHLLLSPPLVKRLTAAGVDREVRGREHASDHASAWIELAEPTKASPGRARRRKRKAEMSSEDPLIWSAS